MEHPINRICFSPCFLFFFFCLSFYTTEPAVAQNNHALSVNTERLTVEDGLSQSTVYSIAQDSKGFMWFATFNGADRYDGNSFVHFRHDDRDSFSISSSQVYRLFSDSKGRLWAGTWSNGLNYFDAATRKWYCFLPGKEINGIQEDADGGLYVCDHQTITHISVVPLSNKTNEKTPFRLDTTVAKLPLPVSMPSVGNARLFTDHHKQIYLTTRTQLYSVRFNKQTRSFSFVLLYAYRRGWEIPAFLEDAQTGNYYVSTIDGVWKSVNGSFRQAIKIHEAIPYFSNAYIDNRSRLWYNSGGRTDTLNLISGKEGLFTRLTNPTDVVFAQLNPLMQDRNGTFWMTTPVNGIVIYADDENYFHTLLPGSFVNLISVVDDSGCLVNDNFIIHFGERGVHLETRPLNESNFFHNMPSARKGMQAWYIKDTMLVHYNSITGRSSMRPIPYRRFGLTTEHLPGSRISTKLVSYSILVKPSIVDNDSCLWLYCPHGFACYDIKNDTFQFVNRGTNAENFYQDEEGWVWMNADDGIYAYNKASGITRFYARHTDAKENDVPATKTETVFCDDPLDAPHIIWMGTRNGLYRMDKQTGACRCFTNKSGLPDNLIYSLLRDGKDGSLWMSTSQGLSCLNAADFYIRNFSEADGLQGREFNTRSALQLKNGIMLFGGTQGMNYFHPESVVSPPPPLTVITGCRLFGKPIEKDDIGNPITDLAYLNDIGINYRNNILSFTFAGIDYRKKGVLQYRYKMVDFDKNWNYSGTAHEATYTNLDPGDYTFEVEASNTNGVWGKQSEPLYVHILPLWWQTGWFYALVAITAFALIYLVYRYQLNQALKVARVRNRIASDLHDEIGSTLSAITLFSEMAHEQSQTAVASPQLLKKINETSQKVTGAMRDIVWSVSTKNDSFDKIVTHMHEHAAELFELKKYELHFTVDEKINGINLSMEKRQNIYLIYKEALNNIVKYAVGKQVWICIKKEKNKLSISVKDDGVGFDASHLTEGNGLQNMKNRAAAIGATIHVVSAVHCGCEIHLNIPI